MALRLLSLWLLLIIITVIEFVRGEGGNIIDLTAEEFYIGVQNNSYDAILDVRTVAEWEGTGHIENATFIESLATYNITQVQDSVLSGCDGLCYHIAIYCQSGRRAGIAATLLQKAGFNGTIYNGLGVSQWLGDLIFTESINPSCFESTDICPSDEVDDVEPSSKPSAVQQPSSPPPTSLPSNLRSSISPTTSFPVITTTSPSTTPTATITSAPSADNPTMTVDSSAPTTLNSSPTDALPTSRPNLQSKTSGGMPTSTPTTPMPTSSAATSAKAYCVSAIFVGFVVFSSYFG